MQTKIQIPPCSEMVEYLASTGLPYAEMARRIGCDSSTLIRIRRKEVATSRAKITEGLFRLYVDRVAEMTPVFEKAKKLGIPVIKADGQVHDESEKK